MAITQLNQAYNPGASLGTSLGGGLQNILQGLMHAKAQQLQQSQLKNLFPTLSSQESAALASLPPQLQQIAFQDLLARPKEEAYAQALGLLPQLGSLQAAPAGLESLESLQQAETPQPDQQMQPQIQKPAPRLSAEHASELMKLRREEAKQAQKEKLEAFKFNKDEIKQITDSAKDARETIQSLDRLEELQNTGKLDSPGWVEFLNRSGLNIPALMNPESEEFQKIQQQFTRNIKQWYGARISNFELEQFLKAIPSLSQSPEGRKRVIAGMKRIARGQLEYNKALRDILKENKGAPPLDLTIQVDERVEKQLDKLADMFKKDLAKPVPPAQSKFATGAGAVLGTVAPYLAKAIPGAAVGALYGGLPGAALGAGAGLVTGGLGSLLSLLK